MRGAVMLAVILSLGPTGGSAQAPIEPPAPAPPLPPSPPPSAPPVIAPTLSSPPPSTDPLPGTTRFDLECAGELVMDGAAQPWRRRFSIDLGDRRYRPQEDRGSIRDLYGVSEARLEFTANSGVDRATGRLRIEEAGVRVDAQCAPQPFTPFPDRRF